MAHLHDSTQVHIVVVPATGVALVSASVQRYFSLYSVLASVVVLAMLLCSLCVVVVVVTLLRSLPVVAVLAMLLYSLSVVDHLIKTIRNVLMFKIEFRLSLYKSVYLQKRLSIADIAIRIFHQTTLLASQQCWCIIPHISFWQDDTFDCEFFWLECVHFERSYCKFPVAADRRVRNHTATEFAC